MLILRLLQILLVRKIRRVDLADSSRLQAADGVFASDHFPVYVDFTFTADSPSP